MNVATREVYGKTIVKLGETNKDIVVLEADISKSTRTIYFSKAFPKRFFNIGIAEQNEMLIAAGMASCGKIPFVSTFAVFNSIKVCEQIRTYICYPKLNVKIAASHGGLTPCYDGVTHQATEDIGVLRTLPNLTILMPCDDITTEKAVYLAAVYKGPVYIRLTRNALPRVHDKDVKFEIGKAIKLSDGKDITIIALGDMVHRAIKVCDILNSQGIRTTLLDMHTVKPIDSIAVVKAAKESGAVLTIEDHSIINGLGSAVAEVLIENYPVPMKRMGIPDTFAESGSYLDLLDKYNLSVDTIVDEAIKLIDSKK